MNGQRGFIMLAMVATMLVTATVVLSLKMLNAMDTKAANQNDVTRRLEAVKQALVQFALINGRLPCPANSTLLTATNDSGLSDPVGAVTNCTNPQNAGTVPWASLGIAREASLDPWGRKLTYRVYQTASGFTQGNGARCDTGPTTPPPQACNAAAFTVVPQSGPNLTDIAFVVISHGSTGYGARLAQGGQLAPLPAAGNTAERNNYSAGGPFHDAQPSDPSIPPDAINHFDDHVLYMTRNDLARLAGLRRDW